MYRVDCALEVLGGAVGREDEEESRGEDVHVSGVAPSPSAHRMRGRREERRGGDLLVAVATHSCRCYLLCPVGLASGRLDFPFVHALRIDFSPRTRAHDEEIYKTVLVKVSDADIGPCESIPC